MAELTPHDKYNVIKNYFIEKQVDIEDYRNQDPELINNIYNFLVGKHVPEKLTCTEMFFMTIYYLLDGNMKEAEKYNAMMMELGHTQGVYLIGKKYLQDKEEDKGTKYLYYAIEKGHVKSMECIASYYFMIKNYDQLYNLCNYVKNQEQLSVLDNIIKNIPLSNQVSDAEKKHKRRSYEVIWSKNKH